jgi:hypothetical protein
MAVRTQSAARRHFDRMKEERWGPLAAAQHGMLSQRQLNALDVSRATVRSQLRAGRWSRRTSAVFSTTTGPLTWEQRLWRAVLHAGPDSLIGGLTAAKVHGMRGWDRDEITVLVGNELSFEDLAGVRFFRTRRALIDMRAPTVIPLCRVAPAVLLFAGYEPNRRTAHGAVAAVVQQRLTDVPELASWLETLRPIRGARGLRALLDDIGDGAQSLAEVDLRRECRRCRVRLPDAQRPRFDRRGRRRFTDAEWRLIDGRTLVLEVDGAFHDDVLQAAADRARNRKLTTPDRIVVSCSAYELRHDPASVMEDLIALGVPRTP